MPHIANSDKEMYDYRLDALSTQLEGAPLAHLTYILYVIALRWMQTSPDGVLPKWERRAHTLIALNEAQHELRRLHLHEYEDQKISENGEAR